MAPLLDYLPDEVRFDGCAYELTGEVGGVSKPVRKPWKVRSNEVRLGALQRQCPGHAEHYECRGDLAKKSELYTEPLVERIGQLITGRVGVPSDAALCPLDKEEAGEEVAASPKDSEEEEDMGAQEEKREARAPTRPMRPSEAEQAAHELTHLPFQAWCELCVQARAKDAPHRSLEEGGMPVLQLDYTFMSTSDPADRLQPVLIGFVKPGGYGFANAVSVKGGRDSVVLANLQRYLLEAGLAGDIRVRTDQEPAAKQMAKLLAVARRPARTIVEESPVKSSSSMGAVERWAQTVGGLARTYVAAAARRWGRKALAAAPLFAWAMRHAAWVHNRYHVRPSGKTPYEAVHGSPYTGVVHAFTEPVLIRRPGAEQPFARLDLRWSPGLWLGRQSSSGEHVVLTESGVVSGRSCRSMAEGGNLEEVKEMVKPLFELPMGEEDEEPLPVAEPAAVATPAVAEQPDVGMESIPVPRPKVLPPPDTRKRSQGLEPQALPLEGKLLRLFHEEVGKTPQCSACDLESHRLQHTHECRTRKVEWAESSTSAKRLRAHAEMVRAAGVPVPEDEKTDDDEYMPSRSALPSKRGSSYEEERPSQLRRSSRIAEKRARDASAEAELERLEAEARGEMSGDFSSPVEAIKPEEWIATVTKTGPPWYETLTGKPLDPVKVEKGMERERKSFRDYDVYEEVPEEEAVGDCVIVNAGWVLVDRPDRGDCRCRLVAQELNLGAALGFDTYAATPTTATMRLVMAYALKRGWPLALGDVSVAFLHALIGDKRYFVRPPASECRPGFLWRLKRAMYGLRESPRLWQQHLAMVLTRNGFERLHADAQLYRHKRSGALAMIFADDILIAAPEEWLECVKKDFEKELTIKWGGVIDTEWKKYLGKHYRREENTLEVRVPQKYWQGTLDLVGMTGCKTSAIPAEVASCTEEDVSPNLDPKRHKLFRSFVGKVMWVLDVRPDIAFVTKELARHVSSPTEVDWTRLVHLARYLQGTKDVMLKLGTAGGGEEIIAYADASWASSSGRRSTSGGIVIYAGVILTSWSRTQGRLALSSCEAELVALTVAGQEASFVRTMMEEIGEPTRVRLYTDSTSAHQIAERRGLGRLKHVELRWLWMQDEFRAGRLEITRVNTLVNPADLMTKHLHRSRLEDLMELIGMVRSDAE